jgi:hypothetical protein
VSKDIETLSTQLIAFRDEEALLRLGFFNGPDYFANDHRKIKKLHADIASAMRVAHRKWGWLGIDLLGIDGAMAAADLSRAAWFEPVFMRECLPLLEQAFRFGGAWGDWFAKTYDAVMFLENKSQVFGSVLDWNESGNLTPWKMVEPENVNHRRKMVCMENFENYIIWFGQDRRRLGYLPPREYTSYRKSFDEWGRSVGWKRMDLEPKSNCL